jgi:zinc transport system substrate-binding protein
MKKSIALVLALLLPVLTASAGEKPLQIVAVSFPAFDFTRTVAGDRAEVRMLLPLGADAHAFEPSPADLVALSRADLLVYNGGVGESWVEGILASLGNGAPATLRMMDAVDAVAEEIIEGMELEEEEEGAEEELDEHVWTSPKNAIRISRAISAKLSELDPAGAAEYQSRLQAYEKELNALDADFRALFAASRRNTIVLGDRFPMRYFTREYGLSYYAAFPGCSEQTEPSARTLAFLSEKIRDEGIPVVFHIEFGNQKAAEVIAAETGARAMLLHSAHSVTPQEMEAGATYLSLMRQNLGALREALN